MKKEVIHAANFLVDLLRLSNGPITEGELLRFREHVCECLWSYYKDHWFPEKPTKGSGYRCIRINGTMDPLIAQAGLLMGIASGKLHSLFPSELTMWVDPCEVSYRIGENGSICVLYEASKGSTRSEEVQRVSTTPTTSPERLATPPSPTTPPCAPTPSKAPSPPVQLTPPNSPVAAGVLRHHNQMLALVPNAVNTGQILTRDTITAFSCKEPLRVGTSFDSLRALDRLFVSS